MAGDYLGAAASGGFEDAGASSARGSTEHELRHGGPKRNSDANGIVIEIIRCRVQRSIGTPVSEPEITTWPTLGEVSKGFCGCSRVVGEWAARRRRSERVCDQQLQKVPSARTIARLMTTARNQLSKADAITIAAIEAGVPALIEARNLIDRFQTMIRRKAKTELDQWIVEARTVCSPPSPTGY